MRTPPTGEKAVVPLMFTITFLAGPCVGVRVWLMGLSSTVRSSALASTIGQWSIKLKLKRKKVFKNLVSFVLLNHS